jgi:phage portal protein BeeE
MAQLQDAQPELFPGIPAWFMQAPFQPDQFTYQYPKAAALIPVVYSCITRIGEDLAALPIRFYRGRGLSRVELEPTDPIVQLWERPNDVQSGFEFRRDLWCSNLASGNAYMYDDHRTSDVFSGKLPDALWVVPGHLARPIPGPNRTVRAYWYEPTITPIPSEYMIAWRRWNPNWNPLLPAPLGLSPLSASRMSWETRFDILRWKRDLYENGANVNHIFSFKPGTVGFDPAEFKAAQKAILAMNSGQRNRWSPVVVPNLDLLQHGITPRDMMFLEGANLADKDVCMVYKLPPAMIGIRDQGAMQRGTNVLDELLMYAIQCLEKEALLFSSVVTAQWCYRYAPGVYCEVDTSGLLAVQDALTKQADGIAKLTGRFPLTLNDALKRMNMQPAPPDGLGDEYVVLNTIALAESLNDPEPDPALAVDGAPKQEATGPGKPAAKERRTRRSHTRLARLMRDYRGARGDRRKELRKELRLAHDKNLSRYEARVSRWATLHFRDQMHGALEAARLDPRFQHIQERDKQKLTFENLVPESDEAIRAKLEKIYEDIIEERGAEAGAEIGVEVALESQRGMLRDLIARRSHDIIKGIDDTTSSRLDEALTSLVNGETTTMQDLYEMIRQVFEGRINNAETIARTETAWAYNTATFQAFDESDVKFKSWLTSHDDAVRPSHDDCEAEGIIAMDEAFSNGLLYPGDESGDASEVCNCRCALIAEFSPSGDVSGEDTDEEQFSRSLDGLIAHRNGHSNRVFRELVNR